MDTIVQVFTIIGSVLGIIAFIISVLNPFANYNYGKWMEMHAIISLSEMREFVDEIGEGKIDDSLKVKFYELMYFLKNYSSKQLFKGLIINKYQKHIDEIIMQYECFIDEFIGNPIWELPTKERANWFINKNYFYEKYENDFEERLKYLNKIENIGQKIFKHYQMIGFYATRTPLEHLKLWK